MSSLSPIILSGKPFRSRHFVRFVVLVLVTLQAAVAGMNRQVSFFGRRFDGALDDDWIHGSRSGPAGRDRMLLDSTEAKPTGKMNALPSELSEGAALVLTWEGINSNDTSNDFIGLVCAEPESRLPPFLLSNRSAEILDTVSVADASTGHSSGRGTLDIPRGALIDMRCQYVFGYYVYDVGRVLWQLAAESNPVTIRRSSAQHGRLSLTGRPGEMAVSWTSVSPSAADAIVVYGTVPGRYSHSQKGSSVRTYSADDLCATPANVSAQRWFRPPGYFHTIVLKKLTPGARYFYRYGTARNDLAQEASFLAPPLPGSDVNFLAFGDLGAGWIPPHATAQDMSSEAATRPWGGPGSALTAHRLVQEAQHSHFLLHVGDLAYGLGAGHVWERFHALIQPAATRLPYLVSIGNHEYDYVEGCARPGGADVSGTTGCGYHPAWGNFGADSGGECGVPAASRFVVPSGGNSVFWYSFSYGNVHVVQLSSEHDCGASSPQRAWLEKDLSSVDRCVTPWVVLTTHRPLFSSLDAGEAEANTSAGLRAAWGDVLSRHRVDLVLTGHIHSYERTCPLLADGTCANGEEPEGLFPAGTAQSPSDTGGVVASRHAGGSLLPGSPNVPPGTSGGSSGGASSSSSAGTVTEGNPAVAGLRGTVHVMAGTGGADYSEGDYLPQPWSEARRKDVHGYLSIHASGSGLMVLFINSSDGGVLDRATISVDRTLAGLCGARGGLGALMHAGHTLRHGDGRPMGCGAAMLAMGGAVVAIALALALNAMVATIRYRRRMQPYGDASVVNVLRRLIQRDQGTSSEEWRRVPGTEPVVDAA